MAIFISIILSPINYILTYLCVNQYAFSFIEALMNDSDFLNWKILDGKRFKFALFSWLFLEAVFLFEQIVILGVVTSPTKNKEWAIKKPHSPYPSPDLMSRCITEVSISHLLRPIFLWLAYPLYIWRGVSMTADDFPSAYEVLFQLAIAIAVDDTLFYWAHRYLHENKWLYRTVHKKHHEFHYNVGINTEYAHPLEDLLSNVLPPFLGPFLLCSHISVCICFFGLKLWQSVDAHCGFNMPIPLTPWNMLPGMDCARAHDFHHSHNTGNYGGFFMFWDWLCGSDKTYKKYIASAEKDS